MEKFVGEVLVARLMNQEFHNFAVEFESEVLCWASDAANMLGDIACDIDWKNDDIDLLVSVHDPMFDADLATLGDPDQLWTRMRN